MVYGFRCDCGQRSLAEFSVDDPEKKLHCPKCGAWMWRDYSGIAITGDRPSKWAGKLPSGYDSLSDYKRRNPKGADFYVSGDGGKEDRLMEEVDYSMKHAAPTERRELSAAVHKMGVEHRQEQVRQQAEERWANLKVEMPKGFDLHAGE